MNQSILIHFCSAENLLCSSVNPGFWLCKLLAFDLQSRKGSSYGSLFIYQHNKYSDQLPNPNKMRDHS